MGSMGKSAIVIVRPKRKKQEMYMRPVQGRPEPRRRGKGRRERRSGDVDVVRRKKVRVEVEGSYTPIHHRANKARMTLAVNEIAVNHQLR